jgi:uncharacterized membrane protein YraQ (UPF0718 family)
MKTMTDGKDHEDRKGIILSFYKAAKSFGSIFPILLGVILLLGLFRTFVSDRMISAVFTGDLLRDTVFASVVGSISAGNAVTSYIIGGELLKEGISLIAVTAFMVAWATVGVVQIPAEAATLGKRFAAVRNAVCFILSILVAIVTVKTLMMIP